MNYSALKLFDISNGPGCRTSFFVSGCTHRCEGCFNKETWDFQYGFPYTKEVEEEIVASLSPDYVSGLTILGGEPMEAVNQPFVRRLIEKVRNSYPKKSIWLYSGYTYEELTDPKNSRCHTEHTGMILALSDVLVDGKFILGERDISLKFRGSRNQRIIDLKETEAFGNVVLSKYHGKFSV